MIKKREISYLSEQVKEYSNELFDKNIKVALIGLGPHAKRIYLNYFKKYSVNLVLLVDIESKKESIRKYLDENGFSNTKILTIKDDEKDNDYLSYEESNKLLLACKLNNITHIIISTEPKAHNMYIDFALINNFNVLTDKPITVTKNMTSKKSIDKVRKQYYDILLKANNSSTVCNVMCQRQYHRGYEKVKQLLNNEVKKI